MKTIKALKQALEALERGPWAQDAKVSAGATAVQEALL